MANRPDPQSHRSTAVTLANRRVLERFAAPFVVVNAVGEVIHFSDHIGQFLEPAPGSPTTNLFDMARHGWALELRSALRRCIERAPGRAGALGLGPDGKPVAGQADREAAAEPENDPLYMIAFVEVEVPRASDGDPASALEIREATAGVADLERENRELRERVQSTAEDNAAATRNSDSSNEELQSVNEELQSTNEELETSHEEIRVCQRRVNTVNAQFSAKVEHLIAAMAT